MKKCLVILCMVLFASTVAKAEDTNFTLKVEGGYALRLTTPQTHWFDNGGSLELKALYNVTDWLSIGPSVAFLALYQGESQPFTNGTGTAWMFGGSLMFKKPYNLDAAYGANVGGWHDFSPWIDGDAFYVHTGSLNRPALAVAIGATFAVNDSRSVRVGPFLRYVDILQYGTYGDYNKDAKTIVLGLTFEFGRGVKQATPECKCAAPTCPAVKKEIPELKESIFFLCDKATILPESFPMLDKVVQAMKDNPTVVLLIRGYASSEGPEKHNQKLSEERANAVYAYMFQHGIALKRMSVVGLDSMYPVKSDGVRSVLEMNRRVDFVIKAQ